jgi:hypothetical protein
MKLLFTIIFLSSCFSVVSGCGGSTDKVGMLKEKYYDEPIPENLSKTLLTDGQYGLVGGQTSILDKSAAWSVIENISDGSIGVAYQKATPVGELDEVSVNILYAKSTDGGKTWSRKPITNIKEEFDPLGGVSVYSYRNISLGQVASGKIFLAFSKIRRSYDKNMNPVKDPITGALFINEGIYITQSNDLGESFGPLQKVQYPSVLYGPSTHYKIIELPNGHILMSAYGWDLGDINKSIAGLLRSIDGGITWKFEVISEFDGLPFGETSLTYFNQKLFAIVRFKPKNSPERLSQYVSHDMGKTWSSPVVVAREWEIPGAVMVVKGLHFLLYGSRTYPYGIGSIMSSDQGESYDENTRISLVFDSPSFPQGGYPSVIETNGGNLIITYYTMPITSSLKERWLGSEVRILKFNASKFIALFE